MEQRYNDEVEINLLDLLYQMAMKWRAILVWMMVGAIALGGLSFANSYRSAKKAANSMTKASAASALTAEQKKTVDTIYSQIKGPQQFADKMQVYMKKSLLMDLDSNDVAMTKLIYTVNASDAVKTESIKAAYKETLLDDKLVNTLAKMVNANYKIYGFKGKVSGKYLSELIGVEIEEDVKVGEDNTAVYVQNNTHSIVSICIYGENKRFCEDVSKKIQNGLTSMKGKLDGSIGQHEMKLVSNQYFSGYNSYVYNIQRSKAAEISDNQGKLNTLIAAVTLDDNQVTYLHELIQNDNPEKAQETKETVSAVKPTVSKKYVFIGAFLGLLVVCGCVFVSYLASGKLHTRDEMESVYKVKSLGVITGDGGKKNALDRWIHKIFKGRQRDFAYEEAFDMICAGIMIAAEKMQYHRILLTGSHAEDRENQFMEQVMDSLKDSGVEFVKTPCILYHPQAMIDMASCDAVVMVEGLDKSLSREVRGELEAFAGQGVQVIGSVIFE